MEVLVTVSLSPASGKGAALSSFLAEVVPDTRSFEGNIDIHIYEDLDNGEILMVEHWQSREAYEKYLAWRVETGVMDRVGEFVDAAPVIKFARDTGA